jgi:hypothetical protein
MLNRSKKTELEQSADEAVRRHVFEQESQAIVAHRADVLEALIAEHDGWDAQRLAISARIGEASRTVWSLQDRLANARIAVDNALNAGLVDEAAEHGNAVGALSLTLSRAQQQLADVQAGYAAVPTGTVDDLDRSSAAEFRAISKSATRSAALMRKEVRHSDIGNIQELGRVAQSNPGLLRLNNPTPMLDRRTA